MVELNRVLKTFPHTASPTGAGGVIRAVDDVSLLVPGGQFVVLVGEHGAGKTTLLDLVAGDLSADSGHVLLNGCDVTGLPAYRRADRVMRVHQSRDKGLPQCMTVEEIVALALGRSIGWTFGAARRALREAVTGYLDRVHAGLPALQMQQVWSLSGGEHQLVALAVAAALTERRDRAIHVLLLDEHVSQLDALAEDVVMQSTDHLVRGRGLTTVMTAHDLGIACAYGDRQLVMKRGRVIHDLSGASRLTDPIALRRLMMG